MNFGGSFLTHFEVVKKKARHSTSKPSVEKCKGDMKKLKAFRGGATDWLSSAEKIINIALTVISVDDDLRCQGITRS